MAFQRGPNIVTNGLVLALDAGNPKSYVSGSTIWYDRSGYNNSGSLVNGPTFSSDNVGSIVFDGIDDNVSVSQIGGTFSEMTFRTIIKPNGNQVSAAGVLFFRPLATGINFKYQSTGWQLGFHCNDLSPTYTWGGGPTIPDNTISDVCLVVNSTKAVYYINGVNSAELVYSYPSVTVSNLKIAVDSGVAGRNFKGAVYSACIYNRALSAQEVLQNYNAQKSRFNL